MKNLNTVYRPYLDAVGSVPVPDRDRVNELLEIIEADWFPLRDTPDSELSQRDRIRKRRGKKAFDELVVGNIKLCISVIRKRFGNEARFEEYFSDAVDGLITAVERFDKSKGYAFSTYATWWIKNRVHRSECGENLIRWPEHVKADVRKIKKFVGLYRRDHGTAPSLEAIAAHLGKDVETVQRRFQAIRCDRLMELDRPVGESETPLIDLVSDELLQPHEVIESDERAELARQLLEELPEKWRGFLIRFYGLNGEEPVNQRQIAQDEGLSQQSVSQTFRRSYARLRRKVARDQKAYETRSSYAVNDNNKG